MYRDPPIFPKCTWDTKTPDIFFWKISPIYSFPTSYHVQCRFLSVISLIFQWKILLSERKGITNVWIAIRLHKENYLQSWEARAKGFQHKGVILYSHLVCWEKRLVCENTMQIASDNLKIFKRHFSILVFVHLLHRHLDQVLIVIILWITVASWIELLPLHLHLRHPQVPEIR